GALPHPNGDSRSELSYKMRAFFHIVVFSVGIYAYPLSAVAKIEERATNDKSQYGDAIPTILHNLLNLTTNEETDDELSIIDDSLDNNEHDGSHRIFLYSRNHYRFENAMIPEVTWSLDVSTGVHLDRIADEPGSQTHAAFGR